MKIIKVDGRNRINQLTGLKFTCGVQFPRLVKGTDPAWDFWRLVISLFGDSEDLMPHWPDICRRRAPVMQKAGWARYYSRDQEKFIYFLRKEDMDKAIMMYTLQHF